MAIELTLLPLPASADPSKFAEFGREVKGVDPANFTPEQFKDIEGGTVQGMLQSFYLHSSSVTPVISTVLSCSETLMSLLLSNMH